jgi:FAD synthetase
MIGKIVSVDRSQSLAKKLRRQGKKIVLVGGCFDILHVGHIRFLQKAREKGDVLFVMLESDAAITKYKGKDRPVHAQADRAEILSALSFVDTVILLPKLQNDAAYDKVILALEPAIIATTIGDPNRSHKVRQAKLTGGIVLDVTERIADASTSRLAQHLSREI